jgi:hypothetical protein
MMPRKEEQAPPSVMLAQTLMTRLGDYTAMDEGEDVYANIKALATTFVSVGAYVASSACLLACFRAVAVWFLTSYAYILRCAEQVTCSNTRRRSPACSRSV